MEAQRSPSRQNWLGWLVHSLILLIGCAAGAALIYSLQPPKPPPGPLLYEIHFFTFDKPVNDVTTAIEAFQQTTPASSYISGADLLGMHQVSTEPGESLRFTMAMPTFLKEYRNLSALRFEIRGVPQGDRIRTGLKIGINGDDALHHFELKSSEAHVVQFTYGEAPNRRWCYAIIRVQPAKPSPSVGTALSGPKTAASTEE